jgi:hypothetical protein
VPDSDISRIEIDYDKSATAAIREIMARDGSILD